MKKIQLEDKQTLEEKQLMKNVILWMKQRSKIFYQIKIKTMKIKMKWNKCPLNLNKRKKKLRSSVNLCVC